MPLFWIIIIITGLAQTDCATIFTFIAIFYLNLLHGMKTKQTVIEITPKEMSFLGLLFTFISKSLKNWEIFKQSWTPLFYILRLNKLTVTAATASKTIDVNTIMIIFLLTWWSSATLSNIVDWLSCAEPAHPRQSAIKLFSTFYSICICILHW